MYIIGIVSPSHLQHTHLLHPLQQCEYCRLYSGCLFDNISNKTRQCLELCGPNFTPQLTIERFTDKYINGELRADYLLNYFGQIFYSQFTGMYEIVVYTLYIIILDAAYLLSLVACVFPIKISSARSIYILSWRPLNNFRVNDPLPH